MSNSLDVVVFLKWRPLVSRIGSQIPLLANVFDQSLRTEPKLGRSLVAAADTVGSRPRVPELGSPKAVTLMQVLPDGHKKTFEGRHRVHRPQRLGRMTAIGRAHGDCEGAKNSHPAAGIFAKNANH
jgi:hypothetical protein